MPDFDHVHNPPLRRRLHGAARQTGGGPVRRTIWMTADDRHRPQAKFGKNVPTVPMLERLSSKLPSSLNAD
jgi:hypothetical protein